MALTLRRVKNAPLSWAELDANFTYLQSLFTQAQARLVPINAPAGRMLTNNDNGRTINCDAATLQTFTLQAGLTQGFQCAIVQAGVGQVQVAAGTATLLNVDGEYKSAGQGAVISVINNDEDSYILGGRTGA